MNLVDYVASTAAAHGDRVAVREGERAWTYAELLDDVRSAADALAGEGVGRGDAVLLLVPNTYDFVTATLGALARRAVAVPVNTRFRRREIGHLIEATDPSAAVTMPSKADLVADLVGEGTARYRTGERPGAGEWAAAVADGSASHRVPETMGEEEALVLHTSGTTGVPKGAVHTHANAIAVADASILSYRMTPGTTFLSVMPLYHCTGLATIMAPTLKVGGELLLVEEWRPAETLRAIEEHGVNVFSGVPTMFKDWLAEDVEVDASSMHTGIIGGAGVSEGLVRRSEALLGCPVLNGWGMTETLAAGVWESRDDERRLPSPGRRRGRLFEVAVVDPDTGERLPRGEAGELVARGEAMMERYLDPGRTEEAFDGEWLHTGDVARIDEAGFVYVLDRVDYTIITGGENVYPREVEGVIEELEEVREAAVVGRPDERKGEKPVAFVDVIEGSTLTGGAIKEHCLRELAAYKHPREVHLVESLPRTPVGKVDRSALEERLDDT